MELSILWVRFIVGTENVGYTQNLTVVFRNIEIDPIFLSYFFDWKMVWNW